MRIIAALIACAVGLVLALLSFPWIAVALGYAILGDDEASDRWSDAAPLSRLLAYSERRTA